MKMRRVVTLGLAAVLAGGVATAVAQQPSLAEVARQEAERRKALETSAKVYTNRDVERSRPSPGVAAIAGDGSESSDAAPEATREVGDDKAGTTKPAGGTADATKDGGKAGPDDGKDAVVVNDPRVASLRAQLASLNDTAKEAQGVIDLANVTIANLFDPAQRDAAVARRDSQITDYRRLQADIEALAKQIAEAESAARKEPER